MSKVAIIGYGNAGFHLHRHISEFHDVTVFSRNFSEKDVHDVGDLNPDLFDIAILSVPDAAVKEVSERLPKSDCLILHTSGSRPLSDLSRHDKRGVLYPLQTFTKSKFVDLREFPFLIESSQNAEEELESFASSISEKTKLSNSASRAKVHLAAVFASNFVNHMYHVSQLLLEEMDMSFQDISHLSREVLEKAIQLGPREGQTGPAVRGDSETVWKHMHMIQDDRLKELYQLLSDHIQQMRDE